MVYTFALEANIHWNKIPTNEILESYIVIAVSKYMHEINKCRFNMGSMQIHSLYLFGKVRTGGVQLNLLQNFFFWNLKHELRAGNTCYLWFYFKK